MIFSRFFAPAYKSARPEKRMQAIENLSPDKAQEKTILHELAFNDDNAGVSLAALNKLNSFVLWSKMSQIAKDERVKKTAEQKVNDALLNKGELALSANDKAVFLKESANADLIVKIAQHDTALLKSDELARALIEKVGRPSFSQYVLLNGASNVLQHQLVAETEDLSVLQKWGKKAADESLEATIQARISEITDAAEKPIELRKNLTLCLSKYQALCDRNDVEFILERKSVLDGELTELMQQFHLLQVSEQEVYREKQLRIAEQVERYIDRIKPEWEAQQQAEQIAQTSALYKQQLAHATVQVNWLYNERLCDATLADVAMVNQSVRAVEATIEQLGRIDSNAQVSEESKQALLALNDKLERFSMQQQYGQKLLVKLDTVETLGRKLIEESNAQNNSTSPRETAGTVEGVDALEQAFDDAVSAYRSSCSELLRVPKSLHKRFDAILSKVKAQEKAKTNALNDTLKHIRKQTGVIDNLIIQGKFRVALSKFNKLHDSVKTLPDNAYHKIAKRFQKTADEISRLEGWQDYLAAPRKPALLDEAKALAAAPADDIKARSNAIKYLRKQWLSLSSVAQANAPQSANDAALQREFDNALENAFEPCRKHYAELDVAREIALKEREKIILSVADLNIDMPVDELAKTFDRLAKQWHSAGQVERRIYEDLKHQWKQTVAPILHRVNEWQAQNQTQKRKLVEHVNTLMNTEDMVAAAEAAQEAQRAWKAIGHSGKRDESTLWAEFKKANDVIFERFKAQKASQHNEASSQADTLIKILMSIEISSDSGAFDEALNDVLEKGDALPKQHRIKVQRQIENIKEKRKAYKREQKKQATIAKANALIGLLQANEMTSESDIDAMTSTLGKRWSSLLCHASSKADVEQSRAWLTVALEVACDMQSPDSDSSIRTSVQLQMMTAKLEHGDAIGADELLSQWLLLGDISVDEEHLKQRILNIIQSNPEVVA